MLDRHPRDFDDDDQFRMTGIDIGGARPSGDRSGIGEPPHVVLDYGRNTTN